MTQMIRLCLMLLILLLWTSNPWAQNGDTESAPELTTNFSGEESGTLEESGGLPAIEEEPTLQVERRKIDDQIQAPPDNMGGLPADETDDESEYTAELNKAGQVSSVQLDQMLQEELKQYQTDPPQKLKMPQAIQDGAEPTNRTIGVVNDQLMLWVMRPISSGYAFIFPAGVRKHVKNVTANLGWPGRFINCLLQGKFKGAAVETGRFLTNTTVGVLGIWDPAKKWGMHPYQEDFGQTFAMWGWEPSSYFMIPALGPSTWRDLTATPLDFICKVPFVGIVETVNDGSFLVPKYMLLRETERDLYVLMRDLWAVRREKDIHDYAHVDKDPGNPSQTLSAIFLGANDPQFYTKAKTWKVKIASTQNKLAYSCWLQETPSPLVFIMPGTGGHRLSESSLALAEMVYERGMSAVTISSAMNWEFIQNAAHTPVPGFPPQDAKDIYTALDSIYRDLDNRYPGQFTSTAVMGLSLGALHTLFISSFDDTSLKKLRPSRFIAINPPVDMFYALEQVDSYFNAPMKWDARAREEKIMETLYKALALSEDSDFTPNVPLPFTNEESEFLIGLNFKFILRDVIAASQARENMHVLHEPVSFFNRNDFYEEVYEYSYIDYMSKFVLPFYRRQFEIGSTDVSILRQACLWSRESSLKANQNVRVFTNVNDFLLRSEDLQWLKGTFGNRLTVFTEGGHLGNLHLPQVQDRVMETLLDLKKH